MELFISFHIIKLNVSLLIFENFLIVVETKNPSVIHCKRVSGIDWALTNCTSETFEMVLKFAKKNINSEIKIMQEGTK